MTNTDAERVSDIVAALHRSITTASNDDLSEPTSDKRSRHVARITAMSEALDIIEAQSKALAEARDDVARLVHERDNATKLFVDTAKERNDLYVQLGEAEQQIEAVTPTPENPNG